MPIIVLFLVVVISIYSVSVFAGYPVREITVIVNYGPGGATDLSTRSIVKAAEEFLGVPVQVINRSGASGSLGPTLLTESRPDGYTIGVASYSPLVVLPHTVEVPFTFDDFEFIAGFCRYRYGIAVHSDSPIQTIEDLINTAREQGRLRYASGSIINSIAMMQLAKVEGVNLEWVPYEGSVESTMALLNKEVPVGIQEPSSYLSHLKSGDLRLLAAVGSVRWYEFPDVPTLLELGYDIMVESWGGLAAPKGTNLEKIAILEEAIFKATKDEEVRKLYENIGMELAFMPGDEFDKFLRESYWQMESYLKEAGLID